jgi:hypothetical protein
LKKVLSVMNDIDWEEVRFTLMTMGAAALLLILFGIMVAVFTLPVVYFAVIFPIVIGRPAYPLFVVIGAVGSLLIMSDFFKKAEKFFVPLVDLGAIAYSIAIVIPVGDMAGWPSWASFISIIFLVILWKLIELVNGRGESKEKNKT